MAKRKKKIEEEPVVDEQAVPTEEISGETCSTGYDMEVPTVRSLIVDATTLSLMLGGSFRPFKKYDQVMFQAVDIPREKLHFSLFLSFRAIMDGGFLWVRPELARMNMFKSCPQVEMGGVVRITKKIRHIPCPADCRD
jgi:hypothetical protein